MGEVRADLSKLDEEQGRCRDGRERPVASGVHLELRRVLGAGQGKRPGWDAEVVEDVVSRRCGGIMLYER